MRSAVARAVVFVFAVLSLTAGLTAGLTAAGCTDRTDDEVRGQVTLLLGQEGAPALAAADKLVKLGRRAIPTIESALHTASPTGKKNLILVLRRIADPEAVPLVGHLAVYETNPEVRREAEWTLRVWIKDGPPAVAEPARAQLRQVEERRAAEETG